MERTMKLSLRRTAVGCLATGLGLSAALGLYLYDPQRPTPVLSNSEFCQRQLNGEKFARTELFFGLSKPNGSTVTEAELDGFIDREVTPRFPDGLTLLTGSGQFKAATGVVIKERSKLLILLYPFSSKNYTAIEQIRKAYITAFQQQSVLRVDELSCISF